MESQPNLNNLQAIKHITDFLASPLQNKENESLYLTSEDWLHQTNLLLYPSEHANYILPFMPI